MTEIRGDWYAFDPLSSITAYEVAQVMMTLQFAVSPEIFDTLPKDLKRHFQKKVYEDDKDIHP